MSRTCELLVPWALLLALGGCAEPPCTPSTWYADSDGDGHGDRLRPTQACEAPEGYVANASDCLDRDPQRHPGAPESCDGLDQDCDGRVDEGVEQSFFADTDRDGYGDPLVATAGCEAPEGFVVSMLDCDDTDPNVAPQASEQCNGEDDDCDDIVDEDVVEELVWYLDQDGDGFGTLEERVDSCVRPEGFVDNAEDCDDTRADIHPLVEELCGDGLDNNCDRGSSECARQGVLSLAEVDDRIVPVEASGWLGYVLACSGDLNRDGMDDVLVSSPRGTPPQGDSLGIVHVLRGPIVGMRSTANATYFDGYDEMWSSVGASVAHVGDPNGDGVPDIGIGVTGIIPGGGAFLFNGRIDDNVELRPDVSLFGIREGGVTPGAFGAALTQGGDLDGNGVEDVVVSDPDSLYEGSVVYLINGTPSPSLESAIRLIGAPIYDSTGHALAGGHDLNGDDQADVAIGAPRRSTLGEINGAVYVVHGPVTHDLQLEESALILEGEEAGDRAGWSVAMAGDVNADGFEDLLVGAPFHGEGLPEAGAVYLLLGPIEESMNLAEADAKLVGSSRFEQAGWSLTGLGDMNGDGFDDIAIGAHQNGIAGEMAGAVYVLYGPIEGERSLAEADLIITGEKAGERAGQAVAGRCDINGDGLGDLVIGAHLSRAAGFVGGAVYVVYGQGE